MNFAELLSLAKQNDHRAKAEIKSSKGPVTEFTTPGREIKVKPDLKKIESRLKEHQQRVEQAKRTDNSSAAKLPQGSRPAIQNGAAAGKPSAISSKSPSAPAQNGNKVPPSSTQSNPRGPMRPVGGSKPSIPASSAGQNGSRAASGTNQAAQSTNQSTNKSTYQSTNQSTNQPTNQQINQSTYQSTNQSTNQSKLAVGQPRPVTNPPPKPGLNSARPNNRPPVLPARATPATSKPRPLLAPPQSFSALLQMASVQQADPSKSFAPPPPSVPRQIPNVASTSRREEMRPNNGHNRNGPTSYPKNPRERSYQQTEPPRPSTKNASDSYDINPGYSNPSVPKGVKKRAHLLAKPQGRQPPTISNGRTGQNSAVGNSRLSGSSSNLPRPNNPPPRGGGPSTSASAQPKMNPYPSVTARGSGAGQRSQPDPRLSQSQIRPPGGAGGLNRTAPVSGAGSAGRVAPVGRAAPGVAKRHLQQQPPPPPKPAVPRAYPNGPSFPAFRPPPRKRLRPDRYEDEDSEYDEEMDDFIDDDDVEGNPPDVSNAIREVLQGNFGYDRRKYVNRPEEDDDDLRHMEAGVHTVWREEERSAEIGRLEDEIAEEQELEEERRALKRRRDLMLMKNKGKRKARISDDEDEDDEEDDDDDE